MSTTITQVEETKPVSRQERIQSELDSIVKLFESGNLPSYCARVLIDAPEKPSSRWSLGNQLLMMAQGTTDARGFQQWKEVNRFVKKGTKAIWILRPMYVLKRPDKEDGEISDQKPRQILIGFTDQAVFRIEDTEGQELEQYKPRTLPPLLDVAEKWGLKVSYDRLGGANGSFSQERNTITLATEETGTFFHELAHAAHRQIDGKLKGGQDDEQEAIAQLSSAVLSRIFGFNDDTYTFHYINGYSGHKGPKAVGEMCLRVLGKVQKVVNLILGETTPKEEV